jgi:MFS family permease
VTRGPLSRTVLVLGGVSLLNDVASDMILPLLPLFLTVTLGAGPAIVGLVEGLAEAAASLLKLYSGRLVDRGVPSRRLVLGGYGLSNLVRPLLGFASSWTGVLLLRFVDRIGKGVRTAPRDALIAASVDAGSRGRAYGFHRSMDHLGAVVGPVLAFVLLATGTELREVFLWSVVPGIAALLLLYFGLPRAPKAPPAASSQGTATPLRWAALHRRVRALVLAAGTLALASVPEAFLVLWATERGMAVQWVPLVWAAASLVKSAITLPAGVMTDRFGRLRVLLGGWSLRVGSLLALAFVQPAAIGVWLLFLAYCAAIAITEPAERALIGDHAAPGERGSAFGWYHLAAGLLALPGAVLFGAIWEFAGSTAAFAAAAALTALAALAMLLALPRPEHGRTE